MKGRGEVIPLPLDRAKGDTILKRMTTVTAVSSSSTGQVSFSFITSQVSTSPATEWAGISARYTTYRVLSLRIRYDPVLVVNTSSATGVAPGVVAEDPSGLLSIADVQQLFALRRARVVNTGKPWTFMARASEEDHLLWTGTSQTIPNTNR